MARRADMGDTLIYGLDAAYPPSLSQAKRQYQLGWRAYGGYLGGPRATHAWTNNDFARLASAGFVFLPIYVGATAPYDDVTQLTWDRGFADGLDTDGLLGECGFNEQQIAVLDAEYGDWQAGGQAYTDYADGWCAALHDAGHPTVLYSDPRTIEAIGSHFDYTWAASYWTNGRQYQQPPYGRFDPNTPPPTDGWQFANGGYIAGMNVDLNSFIVSFPFAVYTPPV